jgi:hypothetical protein
MATVQNVMNIDDLESHDSQNIDVLVGVDL